MAKVLVAVFAFNEGEKLRQSLGRHSKMRDYDLMVADDGSTDFSTRHLSRNILLLKNKRNQGIGAMMKRVFTYCLKHHYDVVVIQAGNNKDDPKEIPRLVSPIASDKADFVQGSRYLPGGSFKNTPFYRLLATRFIHPFLFSWFVKKKVTDSTNGFRAIRISLLKNPKINWRQSWLGHYELEPYLLYKSIVLGYRYCEVPVSKNYPGVRADYTKMKAVAGWWSILRPIFFLGLGIKR